MKNWMKILTMAVAITAAGELAAAEENMLPDTAWEITTLSNALETLELPYSGTGFESWNPVDRFIIDMGCFRTDLDENGRSELQLYWYSRNPHFDGQESVIRKYAEEEKYLTSDPILIPRPERYAPYAGAENTQYLAFDSSNVMYRTVLSNRQNSQEGFDPYHGWNEGLVKYVSIGRGSLIFDGMVQLVPTDLDEPRGYAEDIVDDKLVIWLHAIDEEGLPTDDDYIEGHTNIIITAAFMNMFNEGNGIYNYVITHTNTPSGVPARVDEGTFIRPREWHRLTITAYEDISNTPNRRDDNWVGFSVKLDGIELSTGVEGEDKTRSVGMNTVFESLNDRAQNLYDSGCLFPSMIGNLDYASEMVAVGFQGAGACDDLRFSEGEAPPPDEEPELSDEETAAMVNGVRYATFAEAIKAASMGTAAEPAEMKLVRDVKIGEDDGNDSGGRGFAYFNRGWIILDMNGHTLQGADGSDMPYTIFVEGKAHLLIVNTGDGGSPESLILPVKGQSLAYFQFGGELAFDDEGGGEEPPVMLCMIGEKRYQTFAAAMEEWNPENDGEIELLEDVEEEEPYLISNSLYVNLSGNRLKVDFKIVQSEVEVQFYGEGEFVGEVTYDNEAYAYADGWEFYSESEAENWYWSITERVFPKTANGAAPYSAGNPYIIADKWDLKKLAAACDENNNAAKHYRQIADIDLTGEEWTGIGAPKTTFTGIYDGGGHVIKGMKLKRLTEQYNGLFYALSGTVTNLQLKTDGFVEGEENGVYNAGVVAAYVTGRAEICAVTVEGTITAYGSVAAFGGLVKGELRLKNCVNNLTQNSLHLDGENVAFAVTLGGTNGRLVGLGGNRAHAALAITGTAGQGTVTGFETKIEEGAFAVYQPMTAGITVGDQDVSLEEVFTVASTKAPIVFTEPPTVRTNGESQVVLVAPGGEEVTVPPYYQVAVNGNRVELALDEEKAKPIIGGEGEEETEDPIEVTEEEFTIKIANVYEGLYYRLVYKADLAAGEWTPAGDWVEGSKAGTLVAEREGDAGYYAVQVTDVKP